MIIDFYVFTLSSKMATHYTVVGGSDLTSSSDLILTILYDLTKREGSWRTETRHYPTPRIRKSESLCLPNTTLISPSTFCILNNGFFFFTICSRLVITSLPESHVYVFIAISSPLLDKNCREITLLLWPEGNCCLFLALVVSRPNFWSLIDPPRTNWIQRCEIS